MKIDFHPNKRRLILLSCPLQLISIDSRSPNGLHSLPNFKMVIKMCFNSRSPSRLRLSISAVYIVLLPVSIHAAQAGCDGAAASVASSLIGFQFTQPKRAATILRSLLRNSHSFNSRSPNGLRLPFREGSQCPKRFQFTQPKRAATRNWRVPYTSIRFNSRSPSELRPGFTARSLVSVVFQFTQPKRAATIIEESYQPTVTVSIHAAQAGCDFVLRCPAIVCYMFQFTQPKRAATSGMSERVK